MGPYGYGGVIVDNDRCDPANWNNHGSIVELAGQWYVFYHRATHNSRMMRKACVEPIQFNPDGSIDEVEMTSQGAGPPLDAVAQIDAARACLLFGHTRIQLLAPGVEGLTGIRSRDNVAYKFLDFGEGVRSATFRVRPGVSPGKIDLALDQPWTASIGTADIPADGDWQTVTVPVETATGVHALWLRFSGQDDEDLFDLDWLRFSQ
jgi:hypothetical protein